MKQFSSVMVALVSLAMGSAGLACAAQQPRLTTDRPVGKLDVFATLYGDMPAGITVSQHNRVFLNYPRWGDPTPFTVSELVHGKEVPYPNAEINREDIADAAHHFISVQSVVVDPKDRLWVLDSGWPLMKGTVRNGPKLVCVDLATNKVVQTILVPPTVAGPTSYLNDIRFDLRQGKAGFAYVTDSGHNSNGIIVVDLASGQSWRRLEHDPSTQPQPHFLPIVEGRPVYTYPAGKPPQPQAVGSDGIAISADGSRLYYCPLSGNVLYSVSTAALRDRRLSDAQVAKTVRVVAGKGASDGLESDTAGDVYAGDYETNSIDVIRPDGVVEVLAHDPRLLWPDTFSLAGDGWLYVTSSQLTRQPSLNHGHDLRQKPWVVFRIKTDTRPIRLK